MNSAWMLSSVLVSVLIGIAALCVERVLMLRRGTPLRWVWVTAIAVSIAWSARWLLPAPAIVEAPPAESSVPSDMPDLGVMPSAASEATQSTPEVASTRDWTRTLAIMPVAPLSESAESRVRLLWLSMSAALLVVLVWSHARLAHERRQWRATSLLGSDVLVSNGFGPAVVGVRHPQIVVPPWVLDVDALAQRTILLHEDEHRRARDQWLLLASFAAVALAPWNVVLWLMRRRLARAIELDCDERVLSHGVADVDYANVLLNAWQLARGVMRWATTPALVEHVSRLGRRVEHLMRPAPQGILMKTIGGAFMAVVVMGAAVFVPAPQQAQSRPTSPSQREQVSLVPRVPSPPVPTPAPSRGSSLPAPAPNPPLPAIEKPQVPLVPPPAQTDSRAIPQKRSRLLVVLPWDSAAAPLVSAVHERLATDTRGQSLDVIPHAEFMGYVKAAGFNWSQSLTPADVKAIAQLSRADLVVSVKVAPCNLAAGQCDVPPNGSRVHMEATVIDPGDGVGIRIMFGNGSVPTIADVLVRALHNVPAYKRLLQTQSDAASATPARAPLDSLAARLAETEIKRAHALAIYEPWATPVRNLDAQVSAYQEQLLAISSSASAPRSVAEFVLKRLDERQVALAITHRQLLVRYVASSPEVRVVAAEELHVEQRRAELRASLRIASESDLPK